MLYRILLFSVKINMTLEYTCLENLKVRGAWRATVHRVAKSWTRLKQFGMHKRISVVAVWRVDFRGHEWNLRDKEWSDFFRHDDVDQGEWQGDEQTGGFQILHRGSAVEFVDGLNVVYTGKRGTRGEWASLWEGGWGAQGWTGSSWRYLRKRGQRIPAGRETCRPGLRRRMGNSPSTRKQFLTLLGSFASRVNFWCIALFCILCQSCNHVIYTSVWTLFSPT